jgi:hypothetical protein
MTFPQKIDTPLRVALLFLQHVVYRNVILEAIMCFVGALKHVLSFVLIDQNLWHGFNPEKDVVNLIKTNSNQTHCQLILNTIVGERLFGIVEAPLIQTYLGTLALTPLVNPPWLRRGGNLSRP